MVIKILGPGCTRCDALERKVRELVSQHGINAEIEKVTDIWEMIGYGIARTPGLVINEKLISSGIIPGTDQLLRWLKEEL